MERKHLTEDLKSQYALWFIEKRIMTLCERCVDGDEIDEDTVNQLLEVLLQRKELLAEMDSKLDF